MEKKNKNNKKPWHWSNVLFYILLTWLALTFVNSDFKAWTLRGLMKIGVFNPQTNIEKTQNKTEVFDDVMQFQVIDAKGEYSYIEDFKDKVLFINFWADWCPPCKAEMPSIQELYNEFEDNDAVQFLLIDVDNNPEKSLKYVTDKEYSFPIFFPVNKIPESIFTGTLPTTVVINKDGVVVYNKKGIGNFSSKKFIQFIEDLSKE